MYLRELPKVRTYKRTDNLLHFLLTHTLVCYHHLTVFLPQQTHLNNHAITIFETQGNSGIVHAGFDDQVNTNRSKFCWSGNQLFEQLDRELHFGYQKNGSLVLATNQEEVKHLHELKARGEQNGVQRLRIVEREELFEIEPHVNPNCIAALLAPDAGNVIPYEFTIALAENAVDNGIELRIRREVTAISLPAAPDSKLFTVTTRYWEPALYAQTITTSASSKGPNANHLFMALSALVASCSAVYRQTGDLSIISGHSEQTVMVAGTAVCILLSFLMYLALGSSGENGKASDTPLPPVGKGGKAVTVEEMKRGGSGCSTQVDGVTMAVEKYQAKYIINAAGSASDTIAKMVGDDSFKIKPRLGDYLLLNRDQGHLAKHTLFPCPGPLGKGVLVQTTLWGNLILGPTARDVDNPEVMAESIDDIQRFILSKCRALVPSFDPRSVIHAFCGARAKSSRGDWIIEPSRAHPRFINVAGIDSPGLAGSPAIALEVIRLLMDAKLRLDPNPTFNPIRAPIITPKNDWKGLKVAADPAKASTNPRENVVCKCEKTTEHEIVTALHRSLPIDSTQAIRKRTRAGMGHCQSEVSNYNCECRVAEIIARETKVPASVVGRRPWPATSTLSERWIGDAEKSKFEKLFTA